ncbi:MAG: hypothetical protein JXP73_00625 [Deltaproteobacteria bacterium]|nr:hypothetical protein [Deltaproteobacteria bacterium]
MNEPCRLLEQGATEVERALLDSARADGPPDGAARRMLFALEGLSAGSGGPFPWGAGHELGHPVSSAPVSMAAHSLKLGALAKVGLVTLVGVGALGGGVLVQSISGHGSLPSENSGARAPLMQEEGSRGMSEIPLQREPPPAAAASAANASARDGSETASRPQRANALDESLRAEVRILDLARAAVDARNPAAAQRALATYARRFPQGHLKPEAMVLQLAVLVRQGSRAAARSLAEQLLASQSYKAYEYRIRSLLRETGE